MLILIHIWIKIIETPILPKNLRTIPCMAFTNPTSHQAMMLGKSLGCYCGYTNAKWLERSQRVITERNKMTASPSLAILQGHIHDHFRGLKLTVSNLFLIQRESTVLTLPKMGTRTSWFHIKILRNNCKRRKQCWLMQQTVAYCFAWFNKLDLTNCFINFQALKVKAFLHYNNSQ
jgi:hypothetical protein